MKASARAKFRPRCCPERDRNNQYRCSAIGATQKWGDYSCAGLTHLMIRLIVEKRGRDELTRVS